MYLRGSFNSVLNLLSITVASGPVSGLTCPRSLCLRTGLFLKSKASTLQVSKPNRVWECWLGMGLSFCGLSWLWRYMQMASLFSSCVFNWMIAEGSHLNNAFVNCWALWQGWLRYQIWKNQILPRLKLMPVGAKSLLPFQKGVAEPGKMKFQLGSPHCSIFPFGICSCSESILSETLAERLNRVLGIGLVFYFSPLYALGSNPILEVYSCCSSTIPFLSDIY